MQNSYLILLIWFAIGLLLRFTELEVKSPWTDEFSTIVFSLGNSFRHVPLNRVIPIDVLMQPIVPDPNAGLWDVTKHLLSESNHPPLYFGLAHLWMKWFPLDKFNLLWVARSFPAILGAISIPAIYGLGYLAFRSRLVGNLAAAMMAVSPYGIFLAQEARHYTLSILLVIASIGCLIICLQRIQAEKALPVWLSVVWVVINILGIASHYFFGLSLLAEAIVIITFWWVNRHSIKLFHNSDILDFILTVIIGTGAGVIVWLPILLYSDRNSQLTEWIENSDRVGFEWLSPIFQALAAWITMLSLLPVEVTELPIVIASGLLMLIFFVWATPILIRGIKFLLVKSTTQLPVLLLGSYVLASIALFFSITYFFGIDLTRGARYNFVYFPAVIVLVGASLAVGGNKFGLNGKNGKSSENYPTNYTAIVILLMGFLSSLTVAFNWGYQKYYRPDLLVPIIQTYSENPVLIATIHKTHVQTGEMMGLGWEFNRIIGDSARPKFLLAHQDRKNSNLPNRILSESLAEMPKPFDLWLVNFQLSDGVTSQSCSANSQNLPFVDGYNYQLYHCT